MTAPDRGDPTDESRQPAEKPRRTVTPATMFVIVLTMAVVTFAAAIALWMYWLAGAIFS